MSAIDTLVAVLLAIYFMGWLFYVVTRRGSVLGMLCVMGVLIIAISVVLDRQPILIIGVVWLVLTTLMIILVPPRR